MLIPALYLKLYIKNCTLKNWQVHLVEGDYCGTLGERDLTVVTEKNKRSSKY